MGWQGRCFRRGHRIRKREMWLWYQILPEAWSHTHKKMKQNYKCKTDTHMAQTEHHKYSICIPSGCTSAPHIKKRARNGHQKYIKNWWSGDLQSTAMDSTHLSLRYYSWSDHTWTLLFSSLDFAGNVPGRCYLLVFDFSCNILSKWQYFTESATSLSVIWEILSNKINEFHQRRG